MISVLVLLFGVFLTVWSLLPVTPPRVQQELQRGRLRFEAWRRLAEDPASNGYLSPAYGALWAARDTATSRDPRRLMIKATALLSPDRFPQPGRLQKLLAERDPQVVGALRGFARLLPELQREWVKPVFAPPVSHPSLLAPLPNLGALGEMQEAASAVSYAEVCQGRPDVGLRMLVPGLRLSTALTDIGSVQAAIAGETLRRVTFQALLRCLQSRTSPSPELLDMLATELKANEIRSDQLRDVLAYEVLAADEFFRPTSAARAELERQLPPAQSWRLLNIPGMLRRERRVYLNQVAPLFAPGGLDDSGLSALQRSAYRSQMAPLLLPDLRQARTALEQARVELATLKQCLEVRAAEARHRAPSVAGWNARTRELRVPFAPRELVQSYGPGTGTRVEPEALIVQLIQPAR